MLFAFVPFTWQYISYQQAFMLFIFYNKTLVILGESVQYNMTLFLLPSVLHHRAEK